MSLLSKWYFPREGGCKMELGLIGLGKMGGNMAERLRRAGHKVVGFDFSADAVKKLESARDKYAEDAKGLMTQAQDKEHETDNEENRALRFDIGEGLLELGLVLCSLFFLARNNFFPIFGALSAAAGLIMGIWGWLL